MHESQQKLGAFFFETAGWERPHWYESNADLVEQYGDAVMPREHEWDSRWWSPIINAEHLRMREAAGVIDLSAFQVLDIVGPGDRKSTRLNSSHMSISYAVFCLKKKKIKIR